MNKHTATHNGFTYTRNSAGRTYSHVVLVKRSLAADRDSYEHGARQYWKGNREYYQQMADGTLERYSWHTEAQHAARIAKDKPDGEAWLAKGEAGHVAEALARFDARKPETLEADGDTYHGVAGWCGRPDLAAKLAQSSGGFVVAAEVTPSKPRRAAAA